MKLSQIDDNIITLLVYSMRVKTKFDKTNKSSASRKKCLEKFPSFKGFNIFLGHSECRKIFGDSLIRALSISCWKRIHRLLARGNKNEQGATRLGAEFEIKSCGRGKYVKFSGMDCPNKSSYYVRNDRAPRVRLPKTRENRKSSSISILEGTPEVQSSENPEKNRA